MTVSLKTFKHLWTWLRQRPTHSASTSTEKIVDDYPIKATRHDKRRAAGPWSTLSSALCGCSAARPPTPFDSSPPPSPSIDSAKDITSSNSHHIHTPTVVVFGSTGAGKSSIINMLQNASEGDANADVASSTRGVTTNSKEYHKVIDGRYYRVIDTVGTGESDGGAASTDKAIESFYRVLIEQREGISLVVLVMRIGRITRMEENNYELVRLMCGPSIPVVLVVTGVEQEDDMDGWWEKKGRRGRAKGFELAGHACVTATEGKNKSLREYYEASKPKLAALISRTAKIPGHRVEPLAWIDRLVDDVRRLMGKSREDLYESLHSLFISYGVSERSAKRLANHTRMKPSGSGGSIRS